MTKRIFTKLALGAVTASAAAGVALSALPASAATTGTPAPATVGGAQPLGGPYSPLEPYLYDSGFSSYDSCSSSGNIMVNGGQSPKFLCTFAVTGWDLYLYEYR